MEETLTQFMQVSMANQKSNEAAIKNLETQVGQLAKQLADQPSGSTFTGNTHVNPKGHCSAITTRSGRVLEPIMNEEIVNDEEEVVENEKEVEKMLREI